MMPIVLALAGAAGPVLAAPSPGVPSSRPAPPPPSFARDVAPILNRWCVSCHGGEEAEGDLRLDSYEGALKGGDGGPVIAPGDPRNSPLLAQIERRARPPMPPRKRLPRSPVATIRAWIATGANP